VSDPTAPSDYDQPSPAQPPMMDPTQALNQSQYGQQPGQSPYGQAPYGQQPGPPPYGQAPYGQQPFIQAPYGQQYAYAMPTGKGALASLGRRFGALVIDTILLWIVYAALSLLLLRSF
jgi:hypothetical protein